MSVQFNKDRLIEEFKNLGIEAGDHIGIGLSFKSLGNVIGGPDTFIDALLEVVGPEGTIMANTYTPNLKNRVFEIRYSSPNTGIVPEKIMIRKDAIRSRHPVTSVAAIGRLAHHLTDGHDQNTPAYMPYSRLAESNGKILSIGIGDRLVGFRHQAQYQAGLLSIIPLRWGGRYRDTDGNIKIFKVKEPGGCVERLPELVPVLREKGIVKDGRIGEAKALLVESKEALAIMTDLLKKEPTRNLCCRVTCLWCREIERRLNLYSRIDNPRYFQKYPPIIRFIGWVNHARLTDPLWMVIAKRVVKTLLRKE